MKRSTHRAGHPEGFRRESDSRRCIQVQGWRRALLWSLGRWRPLRRPQSARLLQAITLPKPKARGEVLGCDSQSGGPVVCSPPPPRAWPPSTQPLLGRLPRGWGAWGRGHSLPGCGRSGGRLHPGRLQVSREPASRQQRSLVPMATGPALPFPGKRALSVVLLQQRLWARSATLPPTQRGQLGAQDREEPGLPGSGTGVLREVPAVVPGGHSPGAEALLALGSCTSAHDEFRLQ